MSAISKIKPKADDPRVVRSRAAALSAARRLFLEKGYAGATMEDIATLAGLTKRTLYNIYADKDTLFVAIVEGFIEYAEAFARELHTEFTAGITVENVDAQFADLAQRLALGIIRPEIIALRRLLIGEARTAFPDLARQYFDRAPGQVMEALASGFEHLAKAGLLQIAKPRSANARVAAAHFAYLIVGEPLDRAMLTGTIPTKAHIVTCAEEGVKTFLARFGARSHSTNRVTR